MAFVFRNPREKNSNSLSISLKLRPGRKTCLAHSASPGGQQVHSLLSGLALSVEVSWAALWLSSPVHWAQGLPVGPGTAEQEPVWLETEQGLVQAGGQSWMSPHHSPA